MKFESGSECEFAAFGLGEQASGQPAADRVQFEFRYGPFEPKEETTIGTARMSVVPRSIRS